MELGSPVSVYWYFNYTIVNSFTFQLEEGINMKRKCTHFYQYSRKAEKMILHTIFYYRTINSYQFKKIQLNYLPNPNKLMKYLDTLISFIEKRSGLGNLARVPQFLDGRTQFQMQVVKVQALSSLLIKQTEKIFYYYS